MRDRPSVVFAYTIKGWSLPIEGHPSNHSALLSKAQFAELAERARDRPRRTRGSRSRRDRRRPSCARASPTRSSASRSSAVDPPPLPVEFSRGHTGTESTQQAFGRFFVDLVHEAPEAAERVVTVSPDVASSTNLGGWINRAGIWSPGERIDWFADDPDTLVKWRE